MTTKTRQTAVYRLYDVAGRLLYVGISAEPRRRCWDHATYSSWWSEVADKIVEWWPNEETARRVEAVAIPDELPAYNRTLPAEDGSCAFRPVTPRVPLPPTRYQPLVVDPDLWTVFGDELKRADPELDRSAFLRMAMRWVAANPHEAVAAVRAGATRSTDG